MARIYGAILGLLAFVTTLARGFLHRNDMEATLWTGWLNLMLFTAIGLIIGWIANNIVEDAVNGRIDAELAGLDANKKN